MALRVSPLAKQIDDELRSKSARALDTYAEYIEAWHKDEASGLHEKQMAEQAKAAAEAKELPPPDPKLFEALRDWRYKLAQNQATAPFIIAHDKHLQALSSLKPKTKEELLNVPGFGPKKVETYGKDILEIVQKASG